ncbi:cop9 signalosome complex subunit [Kickxella alabastrina]|uniref:Cop9 signalosome complex subunit n=1 Tax=Kickxella alabastrina TaxID=61397 RepID=A0ACC1I970_9FUNG|nr:cop9 signalosome complex subunit [Kickxella alabastrina]
MPPGFKLSEYLEGYPSEVKVKRAIYIGERSKPLAAESYAIALSELRDSTRNVTLYDELHQRLRQLGQAPERDAIWAEKTRNENVCMREDLRTAVARAVAQGQKREAMRGQKELAQHLMACGAWAEATRAWHDAREYCTSVEEQAQLHLEAAQIAALEERWVQVGSFAQRAQLALAKGTAAAAQQQQAIDLLQLQASVGEGRWLTVVAAVGGAGAGVDALLAEGRCPVAARDLALYGTLAGLVALSRDDIKRRLIGGAEFSRLFDHMPECLRLLQSFYASRYTECLGLLDGMLAVAGLDPLLGRHVAQLHAAIRENTVVLYTQPFVSSSLETMARALRFESRAALEATLARLIERKLISARIDGTKGFLVKCVPSARDTALESVERMYATFSLQAELMLSRVQFLEEECVLSKRS